MKEWETKFDSRNVGNSPPSLRNEPLPYGTDVKREQMAATDAVQTN